MDLTQVIVAAIVCQLKMFPSGQKCSSGQYHPQLRTTGIGYALVMIWGLFIE